MSKMFIKIEGDGGDHASCEVSCDSTFLLNAIIELFKILLKWSPNTALPAFTVLEQCTNETYKHITKERGESDV